MRYITIKECVDHIFDEALQFDESKLTEPYKNDKRGIVLLEGILDQIRSDLYATFYEKAAFLFVSINKGHFFQNGNKRLALILLLHFINKNDGTYTIRKQQTYADLFKRRFPNYTPSPNEFRYVVGWACYNLNKAVAAATRDEKSFDELKKDVEEFLRLMCQI